MRSILPPNSRFGAYLLLAALLLLLALLPEPMQQWLRYDRSALQTGQYWRLFSGHLLHSNGWHLLMNLAGFCRNCLSKWFKAAADDLSIEVSVEQAREEIYGMPYSEWKAKYQKEASAEQQATFAKVHKP